MDKETIKIVVRGRVQGVAFRYCARNEAKKLNILGYARNMPDGTVELMAQGETDKVVLFFDWCKRGPSSARVDSYIKETVTSPKDYQGFDIY